MNVTKFIAIMNKRQAAPAPATENLWPYALRNRKMQVVREGESMAIEREVLQGSMVVQAYECKDYPCSQRSQSKRKHELRCM